MKFLLDANFLMIPGKFGVDVFSELQKFGKPEIYTLDLIVSELERISKGAGKDSRCAKLALELIKKKHVNILKSEIRHTDKEIVRTALENRLVACTQDKSLLKTLKEAGLDAVTLRQKKYLIML